MYKATSNIRSRRVKGNYAYYIILMLNLPLVDITFVPSKNRRRTPQAGLSIVSNNLIMKIKIFSAHD